MPARWSTGPRLSVTSPSVEGSEGAGRPRSDDSARSRIRSLQVGRGVQRRPLRTASRSVAGLRRLSATKDAGCSRSARLPSAGRRSRFFSVSSSASAARFDRHASWSRSDFELSSPISSGRPRGGSGRAPEARPVARSPGIVDVEQHSSARCTSLRIESAAAQRCLCRPSPASRSDADERAPAE